jgi:hypothetical protein
MSRVPAVAASLTALGVIAASLAPAWPMPLDDFQTGKGNFGSVQDSAPGEGKSDYGSVPNPDPAGSAPDFAKPGGEATGKPDPTMPLRPPGREPVEDIVSERLSIDSARRAIDAIVAVREAYSHEGIENYPSLEAFVAETEAGKRLEADIKTYGFTDVSDWSRTIAAVGSAYIAITYDLTTDLRQQIEAVRVDRSLDPETRGRLIAGLTALLPSQNNRTVVQELFDDPIYREKLRIFQGEE